MNLQMKATWKILSTRTDNTTHCAIFLGGMCYKFSNGTMTAKKAMAIQLAPEKIRVNAINPVAGETGMLHLFMGDDTLEKRSQFISTIPLERLSLPKDMAYAALFLCSDEAEMITGLCMEVDGGRCF